MSVEQIEASIRELPASDFIRLAEWLDRYRLEIIPETERIPSEVRSELVLRLKDMDEHPEHLEPFEERDVARLFKEFADASNSKSSARKG